MPRPQCCDSIFCSKLLLSMWQSSCDGGIGWRAKVLIFAIRPSTSSWRTPCNKKDTRLFPLISWLHLFSATLFPLRSYYYCTLNNLDVFISEHSCVRVFSFKQSYDRVNVSTAILGYKLKWPYGSRFLHHFSFLGVFICIYLR